MSASMPGHSRRSLHPSYPSSTPAFSDKKEGIIHKKCFFKCNFKFNMTKCFQDTYPLNLTVSAVQDRNTQLEGCSHHWAGLTYMKKVINLARVNWITMQASVDWRWGAGLPLQALIICRTISAAPRLWSLDCWYRSLCFSISFSCSGYKHYEHLVQLLYFTQRI